MSVLGDVRDTVATALEAETTAKVLSYVPERIVPPLMIVTAGSPYVTSGDTFGQFKVTMSVELVSPTSANDTNTELLDLMIEDALVGLSNAGISVDNVTTPYGLDSGNATYLATSVVITYQTAI